MIPATLVLAATLTASVNAHRYTVSVDDDLSTLDVRACFADGLPQYLIADHPLAAKATRGFRFVRDGRAVVRSVTGSVAVFREPSDDGCIEWQTDLETIAKVHRMNVGYPAGEALVMTTGTWFWRPRLLTTSRDIVFEFDLPDGMRVSVPWEPLDDSGARFLHDHSPLDWAGQMAIGKLETSTFKTGGAEFRLATTPGPEAADAARVTRWLHDAIDATAALWGEFPVDDMQLLVVPVAGGYDAAPWAQTNRGGGSGAHFFMNAEAAPEVFENDWIATHELVHFALPYVRRSDAWLPEGFASYYQAVLRARAGNISPAEAWQELYAGFLRGHHNTGYAPLHEDSRHMHARGRTMRVYWSGAAIAMLADVELRRESNGAWSLDRVLHEFNRCCRKPERTWRARKLFEQFDAIAGTDLFTRLHDRHVHSRHFPRLEETWTALGIETDGERATLLDDGALLAIREAIMQAAAGDPGPPSGEHH